MVGDDIKRGRRVVCGVSRTECEDVCGSFGTEKSMKFGGGKDVVATEGDNSITGFRV